MDPLVKSLKGSRNIFIHGPGGCGKTFLINEYIKNTTRIVGKTAFTGVAALNIGGSTLHSFFGVGLAKGTREKILVKVMKRKDVKLKICNTEILIIDEISMVGKNFFELLDYIAQNVRNCNKPFGGIKIIASGDFLQLPPIDDEFVFNSEVWKSCNFKIIKMEKFYRFTDQSYIEMLSRARVGQCTNKDHDDLKQKVKDYHLFLKNVQNEKIKPTIIFSHRKDVDEINSRNLEKLDSKPVTYTCNDSHVSPLYEEVLQHVAPKSIVLKEGAQVMLTKNLDLEMGLCNGSRGVVLETNPESVLVLFKNGIQMEIVYYPSETEINNKKVVRSHIPLILAYALTIHKVQGATIDFCVINLGPTIFADGQAYVALSRVRSWDSLLLTCFSPESFKTSKEALTFIESLK